MRLSSHPNLELVAGGGALVVGTEIPFSDVAVEFLDDLSKRLMRSIEAKNYPDLMAFSFWCRKASINRLKRKQRDRGQRLGRGLAFHIAPSNVPLNYGYSYVFGLLSGNSNIVRMPSIEFPQAELLGKTIDYLLKMKCYESLHTKSALIKYDKDDDLTEYLSSICDVRIIWGGDSTITNIRRFKTPVRSVDIAFADRYSICVIHSDKLLELRKADLLKVVKSFYNDTFFIDQNACSSPHIIIWLGSKNEIVKNRFWDALDEYVKEKQYKLEIVTAIEKYTKLCRTAIDMNASFDCTRHGNTIYRISLNDLPKNIHEFRGSCGFFFEYNVLDIHEIAPIVNSKYQTLTYFGIDKIRLIEFVIENRLSGIDRIVPIGQALNIGLIWDGLDIIGSLSRIIDAN